MALPRERDWRRCLTRARTAVHQNPGNGPVHPEQLHPHPAADMSPLRVLRGGLGMLAHGLRCWCSAAFPCLRLSALRSDASYSARRAMRIMMLSWVGGALRLSCLLLRMDARAASERCHVCSKPVRGAWAGSRPPSEPVPRLWRSVVRSETALRHLAAESVRAWPRFRCWHSAAAFDTRWEACPQECPTD